MCNNWCTIVWYVHRIRCDIFKNCKFNDFIVDIKFRFVTNSFPNIYDGYEVYAREKKHTIALFIIFLASLYLHLSLLCGIEVCWMCTGSNFNQSTWMKMISLNNDFLYYKLCSFLMLSNFYLFAMIPKRTTFVFCTSLHVCECAFMCVWH